MSATYSAIGFNRQKFIYDGVVLGGTALFVGTFFVVGKLLGVGGGDAVHDEASLLIRGLGTCALVMLHVILWIGPAARLDARLTALLYNRRHLGVTMFLVGLLHAVISLVQYHGFGNENALVSLLSANTRWLTLGAFPFEIFGALALVILFLMAATSHDYWLSVLSPRVWKWLHMGVYGAYGLLVLHVAFGVLQQERSVVMLAALVMSVAVTVALHVAAASRERGKDEKALAAAGPNLIDVGAVGDIAMNRAKVVCPSGAGREGPARERVAVFKYTEGKQVKLSAVRNVCAHQQGPLGEGKVESGCITCPWHGYQYRPGDGCSPPPFHDKVETFRLTLRGNRILLDPRPLPAGTAVAPAIVPSELLADEPSLKAMPTGDGARFVAERDEFYVGYVKSAPPGISAHVKRVLIGLFGLVFVLAGVLAWAQNPPAPSAWPSTPALLRGWVVIDPYPRLLVRTAGAGGAVESVMLSAPGKFGLLSPADYCGPGVAAAAQKALNAEAAEQRAALRDVAGQYIELRGTVMAREGRRMMEVESSGIEMRRSRDDLRGEATARFDVATTRNVTIGPVELVGEIGDPKCYFGAMKPGSGVTHKACAIRCIEGGIAPVLIARSGEGGRGAWAAYVLTDADGKPCNMDVSKLAGEPVRVKGTLVRRDDGLVLAISSVEPI